MKVLGISPDEQKACWLILAAIYHLGAAGATKGNLPRAPTVWLVAQRPLGDPLTPSLSLPSKDSSVIRHPSFTAPLPSPPHQSRRLLTPGEASWPMVAGGLDLGGRERELCESRGLGLGGRGGREGP